MKKVYGLISAILLTAFLSTGLHGQDNGIHFSDQPSYEVKSLKKPIKIDADWNKPAWRKVKSVRVSNFVINKPGFEPAVEAKMAYDSNNIYVIFFVKDKYVRSITQEVNGPVWKDSAVEFFFSPDNNKPDSYFNLEINCGGTPLLGYNSKPRSKPTIEDIQKIEIAHSLPKVVDPEMPGPVNWTVEFKIPLNMLEKYADLQRPMKGTSWRANFYKIAEISTNPHYASWSPITHPKPHFHLPQFFGKLEFQ